MRFHSFGLPLNTPAHCEIPVMPHVHDPVSAASPSHSWLTFELEAPRLTQLEQDIRGEQSMTGPFTTVAACHTTAAPANGSAAVALPTPEPVQAAIAFLRDDEIHLMPREDRIDLVRLSALPMPGNARKQLEYMSDTDLTRLTFLVRRCCRTHLDSHRLQRGQPMLWREAI